MEASNLDTTKYSTIKKKNNIIDVKFESNRVIIKFKRLRKYLPKHAKFKFKHNNEVISITVLKCDLANQILIGQTHTTFKPSMKHINDFIDQETLDEKKLKSIGRTGLAPQKFKFFTSIIEDWTTDKWLTKHTELNNDGFILVTEPMETNGNFICPTCKKEFTIVKHFSKNKKNYDYKWDLLVCDCEAKTELQHITAVKDKPTSILKNVNNNKPVSILKNVKESIKESENPLSFDEQLVTIKKNKEPENVKRLFLKLNNTPFAFGGEGELHKISKYEYTNIGTYIIESDIKIVADKIFLHENNILLLYGNASIKDYNTSIVSNRIFIDLKEKIIYLGEQIIINDVKINEKRVFKHINLIAINPDIINSINQWINSNSNISNSIDKIDKIDNNFNAYIFIKNKKIKLNLTHYKPFKYVNNSVPASKCAKLFFPHIQKEDKLKLMVNINPNFNSDIFKFCWPEHLIYKNNKFAGYVMPLCEGPHMIRLYELCTTNINKNFTHWKTKCNRDKDGLITRLKICINLCLSIYTLHKGYKNYKFNIIDLKPQNILLDKTGKIYIVDLDSIEILDKNNKNNFTAKVLTPEYTPYEKYNKIDNYDNDQCDNFALAVIIYEILFGIHPYVATFNVKADTIQEKIKNHLYVHQSKSVKIMPPPHKEINKFSDNLKKAFAKSFCTTNRTKPEEWGTVLFDEIKHLQDLIVVEENKTNTEIKITQVIVNNNNNKPVKFTSNFTKTIINVLITSTVFVTGFVLNSGPLMTAGIFIGLIFGIFIYDTNEDDL